MTKGGLTDKKIDGGASGAAEVRGGESASLRPRAPQPDFLLTLAVLVLVSFGVVMVFSASYYSSMYDPNIDDPFFYLIKAAKFALMGIALMIGVSFIPYRIYFALAPWLMGIGMLLLIAVLLLGTNLNNAERWIEIGPITIMPGEIAKVAAIFFVAWFFTKNRVIATSFTRAYLPMTFLMMVCCVLIIMQPNLSTAIIVCGIIAILTCIAGNPKKNLILTMTVGFIGLYAYIETHPDSEHYKRFHGFLEPFKDAHGEFYQNVQSLLAFGAGGVTGVGPGRSIQKALYLPEANNDYIFAIIGEEFGFIGCLAVLVLFLFLIWRCMLVSVNAPDRFGMLLAAGVTIWVSLQVALHVAVVTSSMPPTGVALPFISQGGNAILIMMAAMGVVLNISRESARLAAKAAREEAELEAEDEEAAARAEEDASERVGYGWGNAAVSMNAMSGGIQGGGIGMGGAVRGRAVHPRLPRGGY